MNANNPTSAAPAWAEESIVDGWGLEHRSSNLSTEPGISVHFERLDRTSESNEFEEGFYAICLEAEGNGHFPGHTVQIDLDEDPMGDPSTVARRIASQLVLAADALDKAKGASK